MKIVHVITAFGIGGAEKLLLNSINKQIQEHDVYLVYLKPINNLIYYLDKRVIIKQIPISFTTTKKLKAYFKSIKPNIIHTHLGHADIFGLWSTRKSNAKVFITMHNIYFKKNFLDAVIFKLYSFLLLKINKTSRVISISKSVENHVLTKLKLPKERSFLLYNAIPEKEFKRAKKETKNSNLLFVGRLEKQKSVETLIKAVHYLKNKNLNNTIQLIIVGDGKLKNELEHLANKLQIDNFIKFKGKQKEVSQFYNEADIFILPSIWEGFGIVILEAFRAKLAVIASNIEGPAELITQNENGLLFEPENYIELAEKIELLIKNKALRKRIAQKGYETFTKKYHIDLYVEKLNNLYKEALNEYY